MPNFSINPGGFGEGATGSNAEFYLVVVEEYANGDVSPSLPFTLNHFLTFFFAGSPREQDERRNELYHL